MAAKRARDDEEPAPVPLHGLVCRARVPAHLARRLVFGEEIARRRPRLASDAPRCAPDGAEWRWTFLVRLPPADDDDAAERCPCAQLRAQRVACDALGLSMGDFVGRAITDTLGGNLAYAGIGADRGDDLLVWWAHSSTLDRLVAVDVSEWEVMPSMAVRTLPAVAALDRTERVRGAMGALSEAIEEARGALTDGQYLALCDRARDVHRAAAASS